MKSRGFDVNVVADYICWKFFKLQENISVAKLHKLLYFVQAWHLGIYKQALFDDDFEAWVHGPVCPAINQRFSGYPMATPLHSKDIDLERLDKNVTKPLENHVCHVLENFGELSFMKLEEYFVEHELPWKEARAGLSSLTRGNAIISKERIMEFHSEKK